jgi:hypothetical protein
MDGPAHWVGTGRGGVRDDLGHQEPLATCGPGPVDPYRCPRRRRSSGIFCHRCRTRRARSASAASSSRPTRSAGTRSTTP